MIQENEWWWFGNRVGVRGRTQREGSFATEPGVGALSLWLLVACFFIFAEVPRINKVWSYDLRRRFLPETLTAKWLAVGVACLLFWLRSSMLAVCGRKIVPPENTFSNPWIWRECWRGLVAACLLVAAQGRGGPSSAISAPSRRDRNDFRSSVFCKRRQPLLFFRSLVFLRGGYFQKNGSYSFRPWYF